MMELNESRVTSTTSIGCTHIHPGSTPWLFKLAVSLAP